MTATRRWLLPILNVHSALSWLADGTPCSASKAALWSQTNSLRLELRPRDVAALDGIEAGAHEVLADDVTRWVKSQLSADLEALYAQLADWRPHTFRRISAR